jgi:hypothetical protein
MKYGSKEVTDDVSPEKETIYDVYSEEPGEMKSNSSEMVEQRALEVLEGKWGTSGVERRLAKHGIDPEPVMAEVARLK